MIGTTRTRRPGGVLGEGVAPGGAAGANAAVTSGG
jgi:hypothetical protein